MTITFIERTEVDIADSFNSMEEEFITPRIFYPGEEYEVEDIQKSREMDSENVVRLVFIDGSECWVNSDYFIRSR